MLIWVCGRGVCQGRRDVDAQKSHGVGHEKRTAAQIQSPLGQPVDKHPFQPGITAQYKASNAFLLCFVSAQPLVAWRCCCPLDSLSASEFEVGVDDLLAALHSTASDPLRPILLIHIHTVLDKRRQHGRSQGRTWKEAGGAGMA